MSSSGQDAGWDKAQISPHSTTLVLSTVEVLAALETGPADIHRGVGHFGSLGGAAHPYMATERGQCGGPCDAVVCCRLVHGAQYPCVPVWAGTAPHKLHSTKPAEAHYQVQWRRGKWVCRVHMCRNRGGVSVCTFVVSCM